MVPWGKITISTSRETKNTIAQMMVMRSRFFSTMLVPDCVEYTLLAIISETPVPFPECMRMNTMRPIPDRNNSAKNTITRAFKKPRFLQQ